MCVMWQEATMTDTGDCFSYHIGEWRGCRQSLLFDDLFVVNAFTVWSQTAKARPIWTVINVHLERLTYVTFWPQGEFNEIVLCRWIPSRLKHFCTYPSSLLLFSAASSPTPHYYHRSWICSLPGKVRSNRKLKEHYHCIYFSCVVVVCVTPYVARLVLQHLPASSPPPPDPVPNTLNRPVCLLRVQLGLPALASSCTLPFTLPTPPTKYPCSLPQLHLSFLPGLHPPALDLTASLLLPSRLEIDLFQTQPSFGIYLCHFFLYRSPVPSSSQDSTL